MSKMNNKIMLSVSLILLVGVAVLVYAQDWAGETGAPIYKGWNLVYGFASTDQLNGQGFEKSHVKAIYAFNPVSQQYIRMYPNKEETSITGDFLSQTAFWVYSDAETGETFNGMYNGVEYWLYENPMPYNERQLYKGWNFLGLTQDLKGLRIKDIKGSCTIVKICDYARNNWDCLDGEENILAHTFADQNADLGKGLIVKVSSNCKLGSVEASVPAVPNLP